MKYNIIKLKSAQLFDLWLWSKRGNGYVQMNKKPMTENELLALEEDTKKYLPDRYDFNKTLILKHSQFPRKIAKSANQLKVNIESNKQMVRLKSYIMK